MGYLVHIVPAQLFAFVTASSAATIPKSIESCVDSQMVPDVIARFVIPLGAVINMDGGAVYFVTATIWLGVLNGQEIPRRILLFSSSSPPSVASGRLLFHRQVSF